MPAPDSEVIPDGCGTPNFLGPSASSAQRLREASPQHLALPGPHQL